MSSSGEWRHVQEVPISEESRMELERLPLPEQKAKTKQHESPKERAWQH